MTRLPLDTWKNIFSNLNEMEEEDRYDGAEWVEVVYIDSTKEEGPPHWALCYGEELFEDGFQTEQEAEERLQYLEKIII